MLFQYTHHTSKPTCHIALWDGVITNYTPTQREARTTGSAKGHSYHSDGPFLPKPKWAIPATTVSHSRHCGGSFLPLRCPIPATVVSHPGGLFLPQQWANPAADVVGSCHCFGPQCGANPATILRWASPATAVDGSCHWGWGSRHDARLQRKPILPLQCTDPATAVHGCCHCDGPTLPLMWTYPATALGHNAEPILLLRWVSPATCGLRFPPLPGMHFCILACDMGSVSLDSDAGG